MLAWYTKYASDGVSVVRACMYVLCWRGTLHMQRTAWLMNVGGALLTLPSVTLLEV